MKEALQFLSKKHPKLIKEINKVLGFNIVITDYEETLNNVRKLGSKKLVGKVNKVLEEITNIKEKDFVSFQNKLKNNTRVFPIFKNYINHYNKTVSQYLEIISNGLENLVKELAKMEEILSKELFNQMGDNS